MKNVVVPAAVPAAALLAAFFALGCVNAAAQPSQPQAPEAARYRTAQGVEIIVHRGAGAMQPVPASTQPSTIAAPSSSGAVPTAAPSSALARSAGAASPERAAFRVDATVQAERDEERRRILLSELLSEGESLDTKRRALKNPRAPFDLSSEQLRKLGDDVQRHDVNVKALQRELAMLRQTSGPSRNGL